MPEFTIFETYINDLNINHKNDKYHFEQANKRLGELLTENPALAAELGLDERQVKFLTAEKTKRMCPPGLTWHHHERTAKMQLVNGSLHARYQHVGGMEIWEGARK